MGSPANAPEIWLKALVWSLQCVRLMLGWPSGGDTGCCEQTQGNPLVRREREEPAMDFLHGMNDAVRGTDASRRSSGTASEPGYRPRRPMFFNPSRMILSKGSFTATQRRALVDAV